MTSAALLDKSRILNGLIQRLKADLGTIEAAQRHTAEGVVHEESRAENDKDTRGLESSYLARGQAARVVELRDALVKLTGLAVRAFDPGDPIALGALVTLEVDTEGRSYFLAPGGGGIELDVAGDRIRVITASSPIGRALLGRREGDDVEVRTPQGNRTWSIARVA